MGGGVTWVRNCVNHPNCGTTNCNGCEVIAACPAPGACTEEFCASRAAEMDLPFQSVHKSNGAPRGCVMYRGGVTWVRNCVNHPNCGTTNCNGCEVIAACPAPETRPPTPSPSTTTTPKPTKYTAPIVDTGNCAWESNWW